MGSETELKFRLDEASMERLRRHPVIRRLKQGGAITRQETSVYFDTPENHLRQRRSVLRVRSIGRRRVQTLKTSDDGADPWTRHEWQWDIFDDLPDCRLLETTPMANGFPYARLQPIFSTEIRRTTVLLGEAGWQVELVLDRGLVRAGEHSSPVSEAELELKTGDIANLFHLALDLFSDIPSRLSLLTKAERGFALLDQSRPRPAKASPVRLDPSLASGEAFRAIAQACIGQLVANQETMAATGDGEAVHQMRVALRRLRAAINLFKNFLDTPQTAAIKEQMRWLQNHLGPARDAEVFIGEILEPVAADFDGLVGFTELRQRYLARRDALLAEAVNMLNQPRCTEAILRLGAWADGGDWLRPDDEARRECLQKPVQEAAAAALSKRERKVAKAMAKLDQLDDEARHLVRIDVKKLRYSIDFFSTIYSTSRARKAAGALAAVQDHLGLLNDIAVARDTLRHHAEKLGDQTLYWVSGMIAGWHMARVPGLLERTAEGWKAFDRLPRFWTD